MRAARSAWADGVDLVFSILSVLLVLAGDVPEAALLTGLVMAVRRIENALARSRRSDAWHSGVDFARGPDFSVALRVLESHEEDGVRIIDRAEILSASPLPRREP